MKWPFPDPGPRYSRHVRFQSSPIYFLAVLLSIPFMFFFGIRDHSIDLPGAAFFFTPAAFYALVCGAISAIMIAAAYSAGVWLFARFSRSLFFNVFRSRL